MTIEYDEPNDIVTIDGARFSGQLLRLMAGSDFVPCHLIRIIKLADGVVHFESVPDGPQFKICDPS